MYGNVSFDEKEDTGDVYLSFNFEILETDLDKSILEEDVEFKNYIGDISYFQKQKFSNIFLMSKNLFLLKNQLLN